MRWKDIVTEATDYNCPECGDYLGKESEVIANDAEYCGQCGWEAKSKKASRIARTPAPISKPLPKSKQTLVKKSGDYEARIYPGRKTAGLYYLANKDKLDNVCKGEVRASETGGFIPTWYASNYHKFQLPAQPTMAAALNTIKARHKKLLKAKPGTKYADLVNESQDNIRVFGNVIPDWGVEADQDMGALFNNEPLYAPALVHYELGKFYVAVSSEQVEVFTSSEQVEAFLTKYGFTDYDGWDDWRPRTPYGVD